MFAGGAGATSPVCSDVAVTDPAAFDAVTSTARRYATCELVTRYVAPVAPEIVSQKLDVDVQRSHWSPKVSGGVPPQSPVVALRSAPSIGRPRMIGGTWFTGARTERFQRSARSPCSPYAPSTAMRY